MYLALVVILGILGGFLLGLSGVLFGSVIGLLGAEVFSLKRRLQTLETRLASDGREEKTDFEEVVFKAAPPLGSGKPAQVRPATSEANASEKEWSFSSGKTKDSKDGKGSMSNSSLIDRLVGTMGDKGTRIKESILQFFTGGNLVLKIGIIILFFGLSFLLKYAAQRNLVPVEFRLIGVFLTGLALLGIGWRLRKSRAAYGLALQGGGVGVLYLVIFAAAKLFDFLPITFSLVVMICLVALSCGLAVIQESRALAVFGIAGGFLAPVLMSKGGGSHVLLFSYYGLLNCGVFGIAWFKSWRLLNVVGFFFTFGIATLWGASGYQPQHFSSTEPFLILFFLFYAIISVLFSFKQPVNLRGYIDGPLVFGLPLVATGLQYCLVKDYHFGMAYSVFGLGIFYLGVATALWSRFSGSMRMICEAFLALGIVFASMTIPLALDGHWSASIWALEGGAMVWVGIRQQRFLARHFGLLLQLGAAVIFLDSVWYPLSTVAFANRYFLGCSFLALAALFSSYWYDRGDNSLKQWEKYYPLPLMIVGLLWWYTGGLREVDKQFMTEDFTSVFLLFCCASSILMGLVCEKVTWTRLYLGLHVQLVVMIFLIPIDFMGMSGESHLFRGLGSLGWTVAIVVQYRILHSYGENWNIRIEKIYHLLSMWLLIFVLSQEVVWAVGLIEGVAYIWKNVWWALIPCITVFCLVRLAPAGLWPIRRFRRSYLVIGGGFFCSWIVLWMFWAFSQAGIPAPLLYLPFINPLELTTLCCLFMLIVWIRFCGNSEMLPAALRSNYLLWIVAILGFFLINSIVARSVHYFGAVPFFPQSLYDSVIFQSSIAALWGACALGLTGIATRKRHRPLWMVGAVLLGMVVLKLFFVDLSGTGTIGRIVSFLVVGILMLVIGYFSPLPPHREKNKLDS